MQYQPQFADRCDKWNEFDGAKWSNLLQYQPQFADLCDWSKLDSEDWRDLLEKQPQFADRLYTTLRYETPLKDIAPNAAVAIKELPDNLKKVGRFIRTQRH